MSKKDKKVIQLSTDNYSMLINDFASKFDEDFPSDYKVEDVIQFTIQVWNMANVKNYLSKETFQEILDPAEQLEGTRDLFERMIDYKNKQYHQFDKFIVDFEFGSEKGKRYLDVTTGDYEDFMIMMEDLMGEMEDDEVLDKNAIILRPRKPLIDWVKGISEENEDEFFLNDSNVYLVNDEVGPEEWLEDHYDELFERELELWYLDEEIWPKNRTFTMFKKWFKIDYSIMVYDLD